MLEESQTIYVMASSRQEAQRFVSEHFNGPCVLILVRDVEHIRGLRGITLYKMHSAYSLKNFNRLISEIISHEFVIKEV